MIVVKKFLSAGLRHLVLYKRNREAIFLLIEHLSKALQRYPTRRIYKIKISAPAGAKFREIRDFRLRLMGYR